MTVTTAPVTASDATLIARTRLGDETAFNALAVRHRPALTTLAGLARDDPDPLVDETLAVAHGALRRIRGPSVWVRGYLLQLAWRLHTRPPPAEGSDLERPRLEGTVPFRDHRLSPVHDAVAAEVAGLAQAWQAALWHGGAEGELPVEVAAVVGVAPTAVPALVGSARDELRRALLTRRWGEAIGPPCRAHLRRLVVARPGVVPRAVLRHATVCHGCATLVADLEVLGHDLPDVLARHLLGPVADAYLDRRRAEVLSGV